jgi:hypothetical protein
LGIGFGAFLIVIAALLAPPFISPRVPTYTPTPAGTRPHSAEGAVADTVTVDASEERRWRFVDLDRGAVLEPPDTAGWDLMLRRYNLVPSRDLANLGEVPFDWVTEAPANGFIQSRFGRDTTNAGTDHWYRYSYFSHLLSPKGEVYVVRTKEGRYAKLQILSYYCPGPTPGCVTFRYLYLSR